MFLLRKPTADTIRVFLEIQARLEPCYECLGTTAQSGPRPRGYTLGHCRTFLGRGSNVFAAARAALQEWRHFRIPWLELHRQEGPLRPGLTVAIQARAMGVWCLNSCRVLYVIDETDRFGFGYGTLPRHAVQGEERFLVEWDQGDDSVWYDILAFSRPNHVLSWLAYPYLRLKQKHFRRDSATAMQQ